LRHRIDTSKEVVAEAIRSDQKRRSKKTLCRPSRSA